MENKNKATVEGFSLSGEEVNQLNDKHFKIHAEPRYEDFPDMVDPQKINRKLVVSVKLVNGTVADWYANKTSQKVIIAKKGRELVKWIGYEGEFNVVDQQVGKDMKKVIYLK